MSEHGRNLSVFDIFPVAAQSAYLKFCITITFTECNTIIAVLETWSIFSFTGEFKKEWKSYFSDFNVSWLSVSSMFVFVVFPLHF